ncbi:MAG: sodium:solute symporter family protein [Candidatus Acidiferrales bacterium]
MSTSPYFWAVVIYLAILAAVALNKSRLVKSGTDFVLAGRGLTAPVLIGTMLASWIGAGTLIAGAEYARDHGFAAIWQPAGAWLGIAVVAMIAPRVRRLEQFTLPDILELRYNRWAKLLGTITIIIAFTAIVAYQIRGMGIVLNLVAGMDEDTARLVVTIFIIAFTAVAGLMSIAYMDLLNGTVILVGVIIGVPLLYYAGVSHDAFTAPISSQLSWTGGLGWGETFAYFFSTCFLLLGDPQIYGKLFSAKDQREARKAVVGWIVATIIVEVMVVWLAVEAGLLDYSKFNAPPIPADHPEFTILHGARYAFPVAMGMMFLVVATAIIISTATSYLLLPATNFTKNVVQRFLKPDMSERQVLVSARLFTVLFGIAAYLLIQSFQSVLEMSRYAYTVYGAGITPAVLAAFLWRRVTTAGGVASILLGTGVTVGWEMATQQAGAPPLGIPTFYPAIAASLGALVLVSLMTQREPEAKWGKFFD